MSLKSFTAFLLAFGFITACSSGKSLPTVASVDLNRYAGLWYEVAHLPQQYQEGCECTTALYLIEGDHLKVENRCYDTGTGEYKVADGLARPEKGSRNTRLKVQFVPLFKGDYYVLALEEDYGYAMVGAPDRESLWILSRSAEPAAEIVKNYLNRAEELGFDTSNLIFTRHDCSN